MNNNEIHSVPYRSADKLVFDGITHEVRTLTVAECEHLLSTLPPMQRAQRKARMDSYGENMTTGEWLYTADPIRICSKGQLIDGQHRVKAMLASNNFPPVLVCTGFDADEIYPIIDTGAPRTVSDYFKLMGVVNYNTMSGASKSIMVVMKGVGYGSNHAISNKDAYATYMEHEDLFLWALRVSSPFKTWHGSLKAMVTTLVAARLDGYDRDEIEWMLEELGSVRDSGGALGHAKKKISTDNKAIRRKMNHKFRATYIAKAFKLYLDDSHVKRVVIMEGEKFPFLQPKPKDKKVAKLTGKGPSRTA